MNRMFLRSCAYLAVIVIAAAVNGCSSTKSLFFSNKSMQAIQRDSIGPDGTVRTFVQDRGNAVNGTIRLAAVESLGLVSTTVSVPSGELAAPFNVARTLMVPAGFEIALHAHGLSGPRDVVVREDGTLFVSLGTAGQVAAVMPSGEHVVIASGLKSPHGLEMHNGALYYTDETRVFRYDFSSPTATSGTSTMLTDRLPVAGMHFYRPIQWSPSDKKFYIGVGSIDNRTSSEKESGTVMRIAETGGKLDVAMRGLRNTVGLDVHPVTGELWGLDEGTDWVAMDLPPEELNILRVGRHYGWPFYYSRNFRDPDYMESDTIGQPKTEMSTIDLQAHSTPGDLEFYRSSEMGDDWVNSMLITYHGSRDRTPPTGYKVVRVRADEKGGNAREADFITGFENDLGEVWGQPVGITVAADGVTFYVTDDRAGAIYRIHRLLATRR